MNNSIIELLFTGKEYSPIIDACKSENDFNKEQEKYILDKFLLKLNKENNLVINTSDGISKKNSSHTIYSPDFKEGYFGGIVGVVTGQIELDREEIENLGVKLNSIENEKIIFKIKLQIQSRLDSNKPFFLATMLLRNNIKLNNNLIPSNMDGFYDYLLLFWFKEQLQNAYLKGYYRTYHRFEKNDDRLKGSININAHIKRNLGQNNGKIAYSYREYTVNNPLNQLIVAAYIYLKKKYFDLVTENFDSIYELKRIIDYLRNEIGGSKINYQTILSKNAKTISHPYYTEYEELRKTCLKILRDEGISIFDGDSVEETQGILFYLPDLWELYLEDLMKEKLIIPKITIESQKNIGVIIPENISEEDKKEPLKITFPDFVFNRNNSSFLVLDAKFKPKWETILSDKSSGIDLKDYDKSIRDMSSLDTNATGIIFPTDKSPEVKEYLENKATYGYSFSGLNQKNRFYALPIYVPKSDNDLNYEEWKKDFNKHLINSFEKLNEILEIESNSICEHCNQKITRIDKYCSHCGKEVIRANNDIK